MIMVLPIIGKTEPTQGSEDDNGNAFRKLWIEYCHLLLSVIAMN
jgi:hypothetical protein